MTHDDDDIFLIDDISAHDISSDIHFLSPTNSLPTTKSIKSDVPSILELESLKSADTLINVNSSITFASKKEKSYNSSSLDLKKQKLSSTVPLKIKIDSRIIVFDQVTDENFSKLYSYLFGDNKESKLLYKDVPISRFSTLKSIRLDDNFTFTIRGKSIVKVKEHCIKVNYDVDKTITLQNEGKTKVNELISRVTEMTSVLFLRAISNGTLLKNDDVIEGDAVVDLI